MPARLKESNGMSDLDELNAAVRARLEARESFLALQKNLDTLRTQGKQGSEEWHAAEVAFDKARATAQSADDEVHRLMRNAEYPESPLK
ncbi:MAG: hypothetical protein JO029_10255 [Candidatus Eremiobacteraeota bacterium]|nr:hypothetical protein [Candidatus Eremiobacteraeota bacterium]